MDRPVSAQGARLGDPWPRRPCAWWARRGAGDARDAGNHGMPLRSAGGTSMRDRPAARLRRSVSARSMCVSCRQDTCSAAPRSPWNIAANGSWFRAITSAAPTRPAPALSPCRATCSSPRRPSACRCFAIRTSAARSTGCSTASTRTRAAACWSALMRWARRSGSSPSFAPAATTSRSTSTARSSGSTSSTRASALSWGSYVRRPAQRSRRWQGIS